MQMKKLGIILGLGAGLAVVICGAVLLGYWLGRNHGPDPLTTAPAGAVADFTVAGLSREAILKMLPGKTWFMHWENSKDRRSPTQFLVNDDGKIREEMLEGRTYKPELRWVLNDGIHLFVPVDEYKIRGCFTPNGRPKGFFADKPTNAPPRLIEGSPKPGQ